METREELRKKLRENIKNKRSGNNNTNIFAQNMKKDPTSTLMSMGVDDTNILKNADKIVKNPEQFLQNMLKEVKNNNVNEQLKETDEDEEAPPEL